MSRCAVVGCCTYSEKCRGLSFHKVERPNNRDWQEQLVQCINRVDKFFNVKTAFICSRHFEDSCFTCRRDDFQRGLKVGSLPTRFLDLEEPKKNGTLRKVRGIPRKVWRFHASLANLPVKSETGCTSAISSVPVISSIWSITSKAVTSTVSSSSAAVSILKDRSGHGISTASNNANPASLIAGNGPASCLKSTVTDKPASVLTLTVGNKPTAFSSSTVSSKPATSTAILTCKPVSSSTLTSAPADYLIPIVSKASTISSTSTVVSASVPSPLASSRPNNFQDVLNFLRNNSSWKIFRHDDDNFEIMEIRDWKIIKCLKISRGEVEQAYVLGRPLKMKDENMTVLKALQCLFNSAVCPGVTNPDLLAVSDCRGSQHYADNFYDLVNNKLVSSARHVNCTGVGKPCCPCRQVARTLKLRLKRKSVIRPLNPNTPLAKMSHKAVVEAFKMTRKHNKLLQCQLAKMQMSPVEPSKADTVLESPDLEDILSVLL